MVTLVDLWLPIVVAAVVVFFASFVMHMVLKYHANDFTQFPSEDAAMDALRPLNIPPGDYMVPHATGSAAMKDPVYQEKLAKGPVMVVTVMPNGQWSMGATLAQWFAFCLLAGVVAAYVAGRALHPSAPYLDVFRFVGTVAFAGYGLALLQNSIWYKRKWTGTFIALFDALVYAGLTAGIFGWLWPS